MKSPVQCFASCPPASRLSFAASFLVLLGLLFSSLTARCASENLLPNSDFEGKTQNGLPSGGWWIYKNAGEPRVELDSPAHSGARSIVLRPQPGDSKSTLVSPKVPVAPGDHVDCSTWIKAAHSQNSNAFIRFVLAFRRADGDVFGRVILDPQLKAGTWTPVATNAVVPLEAVSAELLFTQVNAPGPVWIDDARLEIRNPVSLSLARPAEHWTGNQELTLLLTSRLATRFEGTLKITVSKKTSHLPVVLHPRSSRQIKAPITLSGIGSHPCSITLLDSSGAELNRFSSKFVTKAPLALYPACPCYLPATEGSGRVRVESDILVEPARRKGLRMEAQLRDSVGKTLLTQSAAVPARAAAALDLQVPAAGPGDFEVAVRLLDADGALVDQATTDVHVRPAADSKVSTGPDGFFRVAGKPFFPIGMYSCGRYEEMGPAGFNGTHNYSITTGEPDAPINPTDAQVKRLLDQNLQHGMRMMVELPRKAIEEAQWEQIRRRIQTFRHHPGLLCWGSEERVARGEAPLKNIETLYKLVRELDPDHPFVLGDTRDVITKFKEDRSNFFPDHCMDAGIWWWYPIPLHPSSSASLLEGRDPSGLLLQPPPWLTTTVSKKPLWIAIQAYQHPRPDARYPTPQEYRALAYLSVINGVKGLWFYTGYGQKDYWGRPAGLLNKMEEGHWDYVRKLVGELRDFSPIIMAPGASSPFALAPQTAPVEFATRQHAGKTYLIAANKSPSPQSVRFTSPALTGKKATALFETRPITVSGETLPDTFAPLAVHIYRID